MDRIGWLRAAVLGANDGIVSTASLVVGVAAADSGRNGILVAGIAGLVAGALSMAAGEYVSVSSQADTERADLKLEQMELATRPKAEEEELAAIYVGRGLEPDLTVLLAIVMLFMGAKRELAPPEDQGYVFVSTKAPQYANVDYTARFSVQVPFAVGAALPILVVLLAPLRSLIVLVSGTSLLCLVALGALAARVGGASPWVGAARVAFWGALAMAATAGVGRLFGTRVS